MLDLGGARSGSGSTSKLCSAYQETSGKLPAADARQSTSLVVGSIAHAKTSKTDAQAKHVSDTLHALATEGGNSEPSKGATGRITCGRTCSDGSASRQVHLQQALKDESERVKKELACTQADFLSACES